MEVFEIEHGNVFRSIAGIAHVAALVITLTTSGCSEGTVVANGHVTIEGKPASGGRLSLTPVGGGARAFSNVDDTGAFALRSSDGAIGAYPGSYRVFFQQPLDAQTRKNVARELSGELAADEFMISYRGPRDKPLVVPESGDENLHVDIRVNQRWTRHATE